MKYLLVLAALALSGCMEQSPFLGEWDSKYTEARLRITEDGGCRYFKSSGGGLTCEWDQAGAGDQIRITSERDGLFVESTAKIRIDELWLSTPSGGTDIFTRRGE